MQKVIYISTMTTLYILYMIRFLSIIAMQNIYKSPFKFVYSLSIHTSNNRYNYQLTNVFILL